MPNEVMLNSGTMKVYFLRRHSECSEEAFHAYISGKVYQANLMRGMALAYKDIADIIEAVERKHAN